MPPIFEREFADIPARDFTQNTNKSTHTKHGTKSATIKAIFVQHFKETHPLLRRGFIGVKNYLISDSKVTKISAKTQVKSTNYPILSTNENRTGTRPLQPMPDHKTDPLGKQRNPDQQTDEQWTQSTTKQSQTARNPARQEKRPKAAP